MVCFDGLIALKIVALTNETFHSEEKQLLGSIKSAYCLVYFLSQ